MSNPRVWMAGLVGEEGLVAAIVARAVLDALGPPGRVRADAWRYLAGDLFEEHLSFLGWRPDMVPVPVDILEVAYADG